MRDLVRGLPRVKAPMEIGESLRGKVERSILLGDADDTEQPSAGGSRWPQIFAIAAIFLLCASLGLVLYKALGPTMKPPVFTDGVASKISVVPPTADLTVSPAIPTTQESVAVNVPTETRQILPQSMPPIAAAIAAPVPQSPAVVQQQAVASAQFNVNAIRQRLLNSGYNISAPGANVPSPALMVVNSTDLTATNAQVAQFLNDNSGISWKKVPISVEAKSIPSTLPSDKAAIARDMSASTDDKLDIDRESSAATTQPASEVYVAKGLTSEQTDALRQSLAVKQQNGAEVQVFLQPAGVLATTQPSIAIDRKDGDAIHLGLPTTEPSEAANAGNSVSTPTTLPANESAAAPAIGAAGGNRSSTAENGTFEANGAAALSDNSQTAQPVDTVIVIQSALAAPSTTPESVTPLLSPALAPTKADVSPATQPSPSTQP